MIDSESPRIRPAPLAALAAVRRLERATSMPVAAGRRPGRRSAGPRSTGHSESTVRRRARARVEACGILGDISFPDAIHRLVSEGEAMWGMVAAALLVLAVTPLTVRLAHPIGAVDRPDADRPRIHQKPIPRIGGIAIAVGILVPFIVIVRPEGKLLGIAI